MIKRVPELKCLASECILNHKIDYDGIPIKTRSEICLSRGGCSSISMASKKDHLDCIIKLNPYRALIHASKSGPLNKVIHLVEDLNVNPATYSDMPFVNACIYDQVSIVKYLSKQPKVNPGYLNDRALKMAVKNGNTSVVEYLITLPEVNPMVGGNTPLRMACEHNYFEIVKLLAECDRVNVAHNRNYIIGCAARYSNIEIIEYLLSRPEVDVTDRNYHAYFLAINYAPLETVKYMLSKDPYFENGIAFIWACYAHRISIVRYLSEFPGINPAMGNNEPIKHAAATGDLDLVIFLAQFPEVDIAAGISWACGNGHHHVDFYLSELLRDRLVSK